MKAQIVITGQIGGNHTISNRIHGSNKKREGMFNSIIYEFDTKREAQKSLAYCWKRLKEDNMLTSFFDGCYRDSGGRIEVINYDASKAEIQ
jgi:hypothetical protein